LAHCLFSLKLRQNAIDLLNPRTIGTSNSTGTTGLAVGAGGTGTALNSNSAATLLNNGNTSGTGLNSGNGGSSIVGAGTGNTATTGGSAVNLGTNDGSSTSNSSGAAVGTSHGGTVTSGTNDNSASSVAVGANTGTNANAGSTGLIVNNGGAGAATTSGTGGTNVGANAGNASSNTTGSTALVGSGTVGATNTGSTGLNIGGSTGSSANTGTSGVNITGNGTGTSSSTGSSNIVITGGSSPTTSSSLTWDATPFGGNVGWAFYKFIPANFWLDLSGNYGRNFVTLIINSGWALSTDCAGSIIAVKYKKGDVSQLWVPIMLPNNRIAFRSYYGGYLSINKDYSVDAKSRIVTSYQGFIISWPKGLTNAINPDKTSRLIALLGTDDYFLGINASNKVISSKSWSNNGHLFTGPIANNVLSSTNTSGWPTTNPI